MHAGSPHSTATYDMINSDYIDLSYNSVNFLPRATRWDASVARTALDGEGRPALMTVGLGTEATVPVTLVQWRPAYGKSRWLVRIPGGAEVTVSASRLSDPGPLAQPTTP